MAFNKEEIQQLKKVFKEELKVELREELKDIRETLNQHTLQLNDHTRRFDDFKELKKIIEGHIVSKVEFEDHTHRIELLEQHKDSLQISQDTLIQIKTWIETEFALLVKDMRMVKNHLGLQEK